MAFPGKMIFKWISTSMFIYTSTNECQKFGWLNFAQPHTYFS